MSKFTHYYLRLIETISRYLANKTSLLFFDEVFCKAKYRRILHKKLDLKNPQGFNAKIQWLKLYDRNPLYTQLADKYAVREYVKERIGEQYLNELIGVYSSVDEIDFNQLPNKFVLKANHGCGWNVICEDKEKLDIVQAKKNLNEWMNMNFYEIKGEWQYKNILPKIICERYLGDEQKRLPYDYKFLCFNGKPLYINLIINRLYDYKEAYFDINWIFQPFHEKYPLIEKEIVRPLNFELMFELAKKLSAGIPFCRGDFYNLGNEIIFGELTMYPNSGYQIYIPPETDDQLGELLSLPI